MKTKADIQREERYDKEIAIAREQCKTEEMIYKLKRYCENILSLHK